MHFPFGRFTVRRSMIAVAVLGLIFGGLVEIRRRQARLDFLSDYHWEKYPGRFCSFVPITYPPHYEWHGDMAEKYRLAATHPWLPVAPDSPPPPTAGKHPCLCGIRFSANDPGITRSTPLIREALEREGWRTNGGKTMEDEHRFYASAHQGGLSINNEATTQDEAWRLVFGRVRALPSPVFVYSPGQQDILSWAVLSWSIALACVAISVRFLIPRRRIRRSSTLTTH